jgi:putative oxidoreductase
MASQSDSTPKLELFNEIVLPSRTSVWLVPMARFMFSIIFVISGFNHFTSGSISYADKMGLPMADMLVPVSGLLAIIGGISIILGYHAKIGAILLLVFLIPVTFIMHHFWTYEDPQMAQLQFIHFFKNISMIAGAILIALYGAGPVSFDHQINKIRR